MNPQWGSAGFNPPEPIPFGGKPMPRIDTGFSRPDPGFGGGGGSGGGGLSSMSPAISSGMSSSTMSSSGMPRQITKNPLNMIGMGSSSGNNIGSLGGPGNLGMGGGSRDLGISGLGSRDLGIGGSGSNNLGLGGSGSGSLGLGGPGSGIGNSGMNSSGIVREYGGGYGDGRDRNVVMGKMPATTNNSMYNYRDNSNSQVGLIAK